MASVAPAEENHKQTDTFVTSASTSITIISLTHSSVLQTGLYKAFYYINIFLFIKKLFSSACEVKAV